VQYGRKSGLHHERNQSTKWDPDIDDRDRLSSRGAVPAIAVTD